MKNIESNLVSLPFLQDGPSISLDEALNRARRLVSDKVGIISRVEFEELAPDEPSVYWARSLPADVSMLCGLPALNRGMATSVDPKRAIIKAIGESVERYCSAQYDKTSLPLSSYEELKSNAVSPQDFALFSEQQYSDFGCPFIPMNSKTILQWVHGYSLVAEKEILLPADFVYVPYKMGELKEFRIDNPISTGLACGTTLAGAIYKGIIEAVERDAFMITWQNRIPPPSLDIWGIDDPFVQSLLSVFEDLPVRVHAALLTLDIPIPVILIMISSEMGNPPYTVVGLGSDLNPTRAVVLALEEACLSLLGIGRSAPSNPDNFQPAPDFQNVENLNLHALSHAISPDLRQSVDFLTKSNTVLSVKDLPDVYSESMVKNVRTMVDMINQKNLDVIFVDLTTSDIDECGFKVVRVVVPGLQPLDINHNWQHLGGERLYQVPFQLGLINHPLTEKSLNPYPHPFP